MSKGHDCAVTHPTDNGTVRCPFPAHRRDDNGQWLCRKHLRMARERKAGQS